MGLLNMASGSSLWRGYDYFSNNNVLSYERISESEYKALVLGSMKDPYHVYIDIKHPKKSTCDCPFAEDNTKICKHKVALFFCVFPEEAQAYIDEIEEYEAEEEQRYQEHYQEVERYVKSLSKKELQIALINELTDRDDEEYDRW